MDETKKVPDPNYDFNTPVEKTSTEIAKFIISKLDENKNFIVVENYEKLDPISKAAFVEKSTDFSIEILKYMSTTDIPADYATNSIDKIVAVLESLKGYIKGTINQNADELMARYLGVRSPRNGKFASECATIGDVLLKLDAIRTEQGNNKYDYFADPAQEEVKTAAELPAGENKSA